MVKKILKAALKLLVSILDLRGTMRRHRSGYNETFFDDYPHKR